MPAQPRGDRYNARTMPQPDPITVTALLERYDALLLDAYGVLVDKSGALPGASALIERLNRTGKPYFILTNSAARLPHTLAADFAAWGLAIPAERIITSGLLLRAHFQAHNLQGARCAVLGPEDATHYCMQAGGEVVTLGANMEAEVVVLADQKGFEVLEGMNHVLSLALRRLDTGQPLHLILCNPDLIYPVAVQQYGFTAGGLALMLEGVLQQRYPGSEMQFFRLGKPHSPIFEEAARRAGSHALVMVGDQLATDILGARRFGIDSVLVGTGLAAPLHSGVDAITPTYLLPSLQSS